MPMLLFVSFSVMKNITKTQTVGLCLSVSLNARSLGKVSFAANKFKIYAKELNQDKRDKRRAGKQTKKKEIEAAAAALAS